MVSVQTQLEYIPFVFQLQVNTRRRPITRTSSSDDAYPTRHSQELNLTGRFRFSDSAGILLLKAVSVAKAHAALWGRKGLLFEGAHSTFLSTAPTGMLGRKEPSSQKSLEDRFKVLIGKRRADNKKSIASSGQVEVYAERETLIDDPILEIDEHMEGERAVKGERVEKEKRLAHAGEELRNMALQRAIRVEEEIAGNTAEEENRKGGCSAGSGNRISPGTGKNTNFMKTRRRINYNSDEDATDALVRDLEMRREQDGRRFELEERRYEVEKRRFVEEARRFDVVQEAKRRKLDVEEKKVEPEIEEQKMAVLEPRKTIDVFASLADKLK